MIISYGRRELQRALGRRKVYQRVRALNESPFGRNY
jgi:hypothetical protein